MEKPTSSIELFKRYSARFPLIEMAPLQLGGITEAGRFYLMPMRGKVELVERQKLVMAKYPYIDLFRAGIRSRTDFKPERGVSPQGQQQTALWKKISEEYFGKRRFTLRLGDIPGYYGISLYDAPYLPARFKVWRPMRGLVLQPARTEPPLYVHWSAFIPEGTREYAAIQASLDLNAAARKKPLPARADEIAHLQAALRECIAAAQI